MIEALRAILLPLWPILAACAATGLLFGALGWRDAPAGFSGRLGLILSIVVLLGTTVLVLLGRVAGRQGLWLEICLASVLAYLTGCGIGAAVRALVRRTRGVPASAGPPA